MPPAQQLLDTALAHARAGRYGDARTAVEAAIAVDPASAAARILKASMLIEMGEAEAAVVACDEALALEPENARALFNRGNALGRLDRHEEALAAYDRTLALQPDYAAAMVNRGGALFELRRPAEAVESYDRAVAIDPNQPVAWNNRARALVALDRPQEAIDSADRALALQPGYAKAWINRGDGLLLLKRFEAALENYRAGARCDPGSHHALRSQGAALRALGCYDEAIAAFDAAERVAPAAPAAVYQRALTKLLVGDFAGGWRDFPARWRTTEFLASSIGFVTPRVRARLAEAPTAEALAGRRVLLVSEQGIGDQLMFASMLPDLLGVAASVVCVCDRRLAGLLSSSFPQVAFFDARDPIPTGLTFDTVAASGDLGHAFRTGADDFPGQPYVRPREEVIEAWAGRLGAKTKGLRVGLSWRGGTKTTNMSGRSIPLDQLSRLLALPGCEFVSLQYGDHAAEIAAAGAGMRVFPAADIDDFEDLAGLVANLDLVVSVQTAVVHLAGALGKACYAMVPVRPEWRYGAAGDTLPWYHSVRIFRQDASEAWAPVIERVAQAVATNVR